LHRLLGVLRRPEDAIAVNFEFPLMTMDEVVECLLVSVPRAGDEIGLHTHVDASGRGSRALDVERIWRVAPASV
jgi:hypothetical protein